MNFHTIGSQFMITNYITQDKSIRTTLVVKPKFTKKLNIFSKASCVVSSSTLETSLINKGVLSMYGEVNDQVAIKLTRNLLFLNSSNFNSDITILINSPGGSVTSGLSMLDMIDYVSPNISTVCTALAASMGAFLLCSGFKGSRHAFKNARIMIHQPLGGASGSAANMEILANEILFYKLLLSSHISEYSNKSLSRILIDTDRDFFMSATEANNYGLVDDVLN